MREVVDRFVGRYQVWRDQRVGHNPLNVPAAIAALGIAQSAYDVFVRHHLTWRYPLFTAIDIAFLVLYFRRSPWAWFILPIWGVSILTALPSMLAVPSRYPITVLVLSAFLVFALGAGCIVWGFAIRRRYYSYIGHQLC